MLVINQKNGEKKKKLKIKQKRINYKTEKVLSLATLSATSYSFASKEDARRA